MQCVQLAGMTVLLARDSVTDVHSDPAAFSWMLFGKLPGLQSSRIKHGLYICAGVGNH